MKIAAAPLGANPLPMVEIEHDGEVLKFSISYYRKYVYEDKFDMFKQINEYWADQSQDNQKKIFDIYRHILNLFSDIVPKDVLKTELTTLVEQLMVFHKCETIENWVSFRSKDIFVPAVIPREFVADTDRNFTGGKTYTYNDYFKLIALTLSLRSMIPIWGEYIQRIKPETVDAFKEMQAFQLIDRVLTTDLPVIAKLDDYIKHTVLGFGAGKPMQVFKGISTSDYQRWLLSVVCIRCLTMGDIRGVNQEGHLITYIHMVIKKRIEDNNDANNRVKTKEINETDVGDGARASALERYKVKADIDVGSLEELKFFLRQHERAAQILAPGIDMKMVDKCIANMVNYEGTPPKPQIDLARWVLSDVVSHQTLLYESAHRVRELLGLVEAVLWHRGHKYLAVLSSCQVMFSDNDMLATAMDSKARIPDEMIQELDQLFVSRSSSRSKKYQGREVNLAMECIDSLTNNFVSYAWKPMAHQSRVLEVLGEQTTRYPIRPDIKTDLARLVIELQTQSHRQ